MTGNSVVDVGSMMGFLLRWVLFSCSLLSQCSLLSIASPPVEYDVSVMNFLPSVHCPSIAITTGIWPSKRWFSSQDQEILMLELCNWWHSELRISDRLTKGCCRWRWRRLEDDWWWSTSQKILYAQHEEHRIPEPWNVRHNELPKFDRLTHKKGRWCWREIEVDGLAAKFQEIQMLEPCNWRHDELQNFDQLTARCCRG